MLTPQECTELIQAAEAHGFEHQGSRGPRFGEVCAAALVCQRAGRLTDERLLCAGPTE